VCSKKLFAFQFYLRALFDYDPGEDSLVPCQDIGLSFRHGDILEVGVQWVPVRGWVWRTRDAHYAGGLRAARTHDEGHTCGTASASLCQITGAFRHSLGYSALQGAARSTPRVVCLGHSGIAVAATSGRNRSPRICMKARFAAARRKSTPSQHVAMPPIP
jgi:hypothetical protein